MNSELLRGRSWVCGVCGGAAAGLHGPGAERWHTGSLRETPPVQARAASCCRAAAPLLHRRARRARGGGELWQSCRRPRTFLRSLGTHMLDAPLKTTPCCLGQCISWYYSHILIIWSLTDLCHSLTTNSLLLFKFLDLNGARKNSGWSLR